MYNLSRVNEWCSIEDLLLLACGGEDTEGYSASVKQDPRFKVGAYSVQLLALCKSGVCVAFAVILTAACVNP